MDPEEEEAETVSRISFLILRSRAVIVNYGDESGN
jgi:hypothetical protein